MTRQFSGWRVRDAAFENFQFSRRRGGYNRRASSDTMASGASSEATSLCTPPRRMRQAEYRFRSTAIASTPSIGAPHLHSWINEQTEHTITTFDGDNVFFFKMLTQLCVFKSKMISATFLSKCQRERYVITSTDRLLTQPVETGKQVKNIFKHVHISRPISIFGHNFHRILSVKLMRQVSRCSDWGGLRSKFTAPTF